MKLSIFLVVILLLLSTFASVLVHCLQILPSKPLVKWLFGSVYVLLFISIFAGLFLEHKMSLWLAKSLTFSGYTFLVVVFCMLVSFLLTDLIRITNYYLHFLPIGMMQFRQWAAVLSIACTFILLLVGSYRFNHPKVVELNLQVAHPTQHKTVRMVMASDIHLGTGIDKKRLHQYVQLINEQNPDIILLAGDVIDRSFGPVMEQRMEEELGRLKAPMGVYAISGNHEYYSGVRQDISEYLRNAGIVVLEDSTVLINKSFYLIGRDDRTNRNRKQLKELVSTLSPKFPKILLDHQPYQLEEASNNGIDLQFSGHTHNGQIFPGNLIVGKMFEKGYGYLHKGDTHYYISSGLGIWGPQYRIGSQSEIIVVNLSF